MDKVSKLGFSKNSPYKNRKKLKINSSNITMKDTEFPLLGVSNQGETQLMLPGQDYNFNNADYVMEYKLQNGGEIDSNQVKQFNKEKLKAVQLDLKTKGLYKGEIDGVYGKVTEDAIRKYNIKQVIKRDRNSSGSDYQLTVSPDIGGKGTGKSKERMQKELAEKGTNEERKMPSYTEGIRKRLAENISPTGYEGGVGDILRGVKALAGIKEGTQMQAGPRGDAWKMYLGLPQTENTFNVSEYTPSKGNKNETYYSINLTDEDRQQIIQQTLQGLDEENINYGGLNYGLTPYQKTVKAKHYYDEGQIDEKKLNKILTKYKGSPKSTFIDYGDIMGQYTSSLGEDEQGKYISYYDVWDFNVPGSKVVGKPFNIYDRIYLNDDNTMKKQKGGYVNLLQNYLPTIPENQQDELLDTLDALPEQERYDALEEYMNGGCYKCGGKVSKTMQSGGHTPTYPELGQGNVEVEDQETVKTPDGKLFKFEGDTHEQGGIQTQLPGGSIIFSDHIKAPQNITELVLGRKTNKKYSYADLSKKFPTQKSLNTLKNPDSDQFETNTAELTLNKNQAMLDTIFGAQEAEKMQKSKTKFQKGGKLYAQAGLKVENNQFNMSPQDWITYQATGAFPTTPINSQGYDYQFDYPTVHTEPSPTVTTGVVLPQGIGLADMSMPQFNVPTDLQLVMPDRSKAQPVQRKPIGKGRPVKASTPAPLEDNFKTSIPVPFDSIPQRDLSSQLTYSRNPFEKTQTESDTNTTSSDSENYPGFAKSRGKSKFGINPKLAGTIMDIGLALSDNLNVEGPVLFNNKTYPLFNRFVNFDNKEPGRNLSLSVQQIQNSNMPEQVKQAQIAQLTAQANEQQSQVDFGNQQRYEQKQERDINKLQQYQDRNTLVGNQDLENYLQRKGRVESLKNEFKARRKSNIVNSIRGYADYADTLNLQNQIYADNYKVNAITGRVDFTGGKQDPLKQQEQLMQQYQQNVQNQISLPNGATMTLLGNGHAVVVDSDGKTQIVKTSQ